MKWEHKKGRTHILEQVVFLDNAKKKKKGEKKVSFLDGEELNIHGLDLKKKITG
jgi:hypothetical protein